LHSWSFAQLAWFINLQSNAMRGAGGLCGPEAHKSAMQPVSAHRTGKSKVQGSLCLQGVRAHRTCRRERSQKHQTERPGASWFGGCHTAIRGGN
jgi:hypothetical protein